MSPEMEARRQDETAAAVRRVCAGVLVRLEEAELAVLQGLAPLGLVSRDAELAGQSSTLYFLVYVLGSYIVQGREPAKLLGAVARNVETPASQEAFARAGVELEEELARVKAGEVNPA